MATNLALGLIRKGAGRAGAVPVAGQPHDQTVSDRQALVAALLGLPRRQRETVALRYLGDLTEAQVAEALGCSIGSVKQHGSRGLAALRLSLDADHFGPEGALHVEPAR